MFPPWVMLGMLFALSTLVQDLQDIVMLTVSAAIGHQTDPGCELCTHHPGNQIRQTGAPCFVPPSLHMGLRHTHTRTPCVVSTRLLQWAGHKITALALKVTELDEHGEIDCRKLCFGTSPCSDLCGNITDTMRKSESYPCYAAGLCPDQEGDITCRFDWKQLRCSPQASCTRKFPARCVVNDGLLSWRRQAALVGRHAGLVARALHEQPSCGEPDAGPYCRHEPSGVSHACELTCWVLPFVVGTIASIRAVETPGGDDDRQWLTFWVCVRDRASPLTLPPQVPLRGRSR